MDTGLNQQETENSPVRLSAASSPCIRYSPLAFSYELATFPVSPNSGVPAPTVKSISLPVLSSIGADVSLKCHTPT